MSLHNPPKYGNNIVRVPKDTGNNIEVIFSDPRQQLFNYQTVQAGIDTNVKNNPPKPKTIEEITLVEPELPIIIGQHPNKPVHMNTLAYQGNNPSKYDI